MNRRRRNEWQKCSQRHRGYNDSCKERFTVMMMEVVPSFERIHASGARIKQPVTCVERPYCGCHGDGGDQRQ